MVLDIDGQDSPSTVHLRVRPQHKTEWPDAERVNHISPASVSSYKPFERYLEAVQFLFDRTEKIVGWNVNFDLGFLENEGVVIPQTTKVIDAMELRARIWPVLRNHTRWRLTSAADAAGYSFEGAPHTALADAWLPGIYIYTPNRSSKAIDIRGQMSNAPEPTGISRKLSPCGTKPVCTGGLYGENCIWGRPSVRPNAHRRKEVPAMPGENEEAMRVLLMLGQAVMPPAREVLILTMRALARGTGKVAALPAGRPARREPCDQPCKRTRALRSCDRAYLEARPQRRHQARQPRQGGRARPAATCRSFPTSAAGTASVRGFRDPATGYFAIEYKMKDQEALAACIETAIQRKLISNATWIGAMRGPVEARATAPSRSIRVMSARLSNQKIIRRFPQSGFPPLASLRLACRPRRKASNTSGSLGNSTSPMACTSVNSPVGTALPTPPP